MHLSAVLTLLYVAGALSNPVKRDVVWVKSTMVETVYVTRGNLPAKTPEPNPRAKHYGYRKTWYYEAPAPVNTPSSTVVEPKATSTPVVVQPKPEEKPTPIIVNTKPTTAASVDDEITTPAPPPPSSTPVQVPVRSPSPKPIPAATEEVDDGSPKSDGVTLLTTINKYRKAYNVNTLTWSSKLAGNALKTGTDGGGVNQVHQLNPGTYGQVITPGTDHRTGDMKYDPDTSFELSFVAWLCEVSSDPQLKSPIDQCALVAKNLHMYYSDTGHHDILTSSSYKTIGCAFAKNPNAAPNSPYQGLWVCDLGF